jgi:hypothetical protein
VAVQFSYLQQNPDGSVSTQGVTADRAPTWGELQNHVASSGATLLPATPAEQPPPQQASEPAAPPPAPAAAAPPAGVTPKQAAAQASATQAIQEAMPAPPTSRYLIPASAATLGAWALPAAATAFLGPLGPPAQAGLAAIGAGVAGGIGEYGQAQGERMVYGEPPPGSPTPAERAVHFANTVAPVEAAVQTAAPFLLPLVQSATKPLGSQAVSSASDAPVLSTGALGGEPGTIRAGQAAAKNVAKNLEAAHAATSIDLGNAAPPIAVNTDGLPPLVAQARAALARQGATDAELAMFESQMAPIVQGGPQALQRILAVERNLNRWAARVPSTVQLPELNTLGRNTQTAITTGVAGTPTAQPWQNYLNDLATTTPTRVVLHQAADAGPTEFQPWLHAEGQSGLDAIIKQASPADQAAVGRAWLASVRQGARTAIDPVKYVADAYEALPASYRTALFPDQSPAVAQLIGAAQSSPKFLLPKIGVPIAQPWARGVLLSPTGALATRLATGAVTGVGRTALYAGAAEANEPRSGPQP